MAPHLGAESECRARAAERGEMGTHSYLACRRWIAQRIDDAIHMARIMQRNSGKGDLPIHGAG